MTIFLYKIYGYIHNLKERAIYKNKDKNKNEKPKLNITNKKIKPNKHPLNIHHDRSNKTRQYYKKYKNLIIINLNVNDIKRQQIFKYLENKKAQIILLQETHSNPKIVKKCEKEWKVNLSSIQTIKKNPPEWLYP